MSKKADVLFKAIDVLSKEIKINRHTCYKCGRVSMYMKRIHLAVLKKYKYVCKYGC